MGAMALAAVVGGAPLSGGEAALKVAEAGYQAEKSSFLDLLDAAKNRSLELEKREEAVKAREAAMNRSTWRYFHCEKVCDWR